MTGPRVAIVAVSHSAELAAGVAELAAQMAPDVTIIGVGGSDGGLGTSFEAITDALQGADSAAGIVVLYDLGSARLTSESVIEFLDPQLAERIRIVDAPLVEGAIAAAVEAQSGADRAAVSAAARSAAGAWPAAAGTAGAGTTGAAGAEEARAEAAAQPSAPVLTRSVRLRNKLGLHARPAAELIRQVANLDAQVRIGRSGKPATDLRSLLGVVSLALRGGETAELSASGPDASTALDRVEGLIETGFGEDDASTAGSAGTQPADSAPSGPARPAGAGAGAAARAPARGAPGRAIGPAVRLAVPDVPDRPGSGTDRERGRLNTALEAATRPLAAGDAMSRAHAVLVADPQLWTEAERGLAGGLAAAPAWWRAVTVLAEQFAASPDELVAARAADVREAGAAVLNELGEVVDRIPPASALRGAVLVADELGPGEVARAVERGAVAIALSRGSPTAHAVLVSRNLGVPMVLGAERDLENLRPGAVLDVDGTEGTVQADPPDLAERRQAVAAAAQRSARARKLAAAPVQYRGRPIRVAANIGSAAEARAAVAAGADGVGLLRTELLMLDLPQLPGEDAQTAQLAEIFGVLGERPVVVRVLDVGGDKPMRALALDPQRNGFLGVRGLRWLLRHPDVLHTQLRAICRAAVGHRVEVMAPMVTVAAEAVAFREAVGRAADSLAAGGIAHTHPDRVGVMIEVPAAALTTDEIGAEVDFVSVGTNDLVAYTMAADRTEPGTAALADPSATAVWRLLEQVCAGAARSNTDVSVCGELAADGRYAARLVELGVTELSMAAGRIPAVKALLRAG
ncbi:MAG: dihydroxyacetone kinase phosphoryl donor subunit DhaM [Streptosporangiaceae bacterium]